MTALLDAWQAALGAEQQAAFGYALLGPRLPTSEQDRARAGQATHEAIRDATADAIAAAGATPQAPAGDYPALYPRARAPHALAGYLEESCAAAWRYLYARASAGAGHAELRRHAQAQLIASAVRATKWTGKTQPFPGV